MTDIMLTSRVTTKAEGIHNSGHCRPFYCIEKATPFTSIQDGAKALEVSYAALWKHLHNKARSCKGFHCYFLDERDEHFEEMSTHIREMHERASELARKAALWDAYEAEQEAKRKAEEARQQALEKAKAKLERRKIALENAKAAAQRALERMHEAERELEELTA